MLGKTISSTGEFVRVGGFFSYSHFSSYNSYGGVMEMRRGKGRGGRTPKEWSQENKWSK